MPDLHQLLLDESSRLRPAGAPPFDDLVRRHRRRSRRRQAVVVGACAVAVASVAVLAPEFGGGSSVERLAQPPTTASVPTPAPLSPPGAGASFRVLDAEGQPLADDDWELVADPAVRVTVEVSRAAPPEMCLLFFDVVPEDGGRLAGQLRLPEDGPGVVPDLDRYRFTWTARDVEQRPLPPGRYLLVAHTEVQDEEASCGTVGYRGPKRKVQSTLGVFVVPP